MNLARIYQISGAGLLAISLTLLSLTSSVKAQIDVEPDIEPNIAVVEEEDGFDWGWLGLLGLLGLGGLAGKNNSDRHEVRNTEPFPEAPKRNR